MLDDALHPLLSRARPVSQSELGMFPASSGSRRRWLKPRLGYAVAEVDVRSALTPFALHDGTWSLNPYSGCAHDCVYCYVPDVLHVERARYGSYVVAKRNLPTVLARELKRKERRTVFLSSATDPYQAAEGVYGITQRALRLLERAGWPVSILTRNPLVRRDLPLLSRFEEASIGFSIPTFDDEARRVLEPGAPPITGRLAAVRAAADAGLAPFVNLAPMYPFSAGVGPRDIAEALRDAGAVEVYAGPWRYLDGVAPALSARVAGTPFERFTSDVREAGYYDRMFRAMRAALAAVGIGFQVMGDPRPGATPRRWGGAKPPLPASGPVQTSLDGPVRAATPVS